MSRDTRPPSCEKNKRADVKEYMEGLREMASQCPSLGTPAPAPFQPAALRGPAELIQFRTHRKRREIIQCLVLFQSAKLWGDLSHNNREPEQLSCPQNQFSKVNES